MIPVTWVKEDRLLESPGKSVFVILPTKGCSWNRCRMCNYPVPSKNVTQEEIRRQFDYIMNKIKDEHSLKIFTSGSFFDERELSKETIDYIFKKVDENENIREFVVESRPEFIKNLDEFNIPEKYFEVAIGLESANDFTRNLLIDKGVPYSVFEDAVFYLKEKGIGVKIYLLLKPPMLYERESINDVIYSLKKIKYLKVNTVSINPCTVHKNTLTEKLFFKRQYRPPWLWSVVETCKQALKILEKTRIIVDPVGAGSLRGPHNCGSCDKKIKEKIDEFTLYQTDKVFKNLECNCKSLWKSILELEDYCRGIDLYNTLEFMEKMK